MDLDPSPLFRDLETGERPVVAVSGGSDSLALLLLAHDYLSRHRPSARLLAVTVDHGLRPESAAEAARVASLCRALGIAHETVAWRGEKPRTGLAAAAREARYRLLADAAARAGATLVLTGHTLDDQAETLAMRAMRGEGAGREGPGMAGMARATLFDNRVWIARPLLSLRRQALRAWLRGRGVEWIDDPSNENPAYERARVRRQLSARESAVLAARAQERGIARLALARQAAALVARHATRAAPGLLRLERALFGAATQDREAATLALRVALAAAGGASRLPDLARVEALHDRLAQGAPLRATPLRVTPLRATLSRAVVDARKNGVFIRREARDLPAVPLDGATILWDGRWRVTAAAEPAGLSVGPLGRAAAKALAAKSEAPHAPAPPALVLAALAAQPALFTGGSLVGPPGGSDAVAHGVSAIPVVAPFARFMPAFEEPLAAVFAALVGAPPPPAGPWRGHIAVRA